MTLIAHYPLAGDAVAEVGTDGTLVGDPELTAGVGGQLTDGALALDGTLDHVQIDDAALESVLTPSGTWTISLWVKVTTAGYIFALTVGSDVVGIIVSGGGFLFDLISGGATSILAGDSTDGEWHHLVFVNNAGTPSAYVDGVVETTTGTTLISTSQSGIIYLGSRTSAGANLLTGSLDDLRIYDHALTADEIDVLFAEGIADLAGLQIAADRQAITTLTETQDFTVSGVKVPKAVLQFSAGTAVTNDTVGQHCLFTAGLGVSPTNRAYAFTRSENNVATAPDGHIANVDNIWFRTGGGSMIQVGAADLDAMINDGVRLDVTDPSGAALIHSLFFGGADLEAFLVKLTENQSDGQSSDETIPWIPDAAILLSTIDDFQGGSHDGYANMVFGFLSVAPDGTVSLVGQCNAFHYTGGVHSCYGYVSDDSLPMIDPTQSTAGIDGEFTISFPDSTTARLHTVSRTGDLAAAEIMMLGLKLGNYQAQASILTMPDSTGVGAVDFSPAPGFTPQTVLAALNQITAVNTFRASAEAGTFGLSAITRPPGVEGTDGDKEYCCTSSAEDGEATTDTQSLASDKAFYIPPDDGTATGRILAAFDSFLEGGMNVNVTTAGGAVKLPALSFSNAEIATGDAMIRDPYSDVYRDVYSEVYR